MSPNLGPRCSRRPSWSGDPQLGWSYGGWHPGLNQPQRYLVKRVGGFLVLHCAENVCWEAGAIGRPDHWAANEISGVWCSDDPQCCFCLGAGEVYLRGGQYSCRSRPEETPNVRRGYPG